MDSIDDKNKKSNIERVSNSLIFYKSVLFFVKSAFFMACLFCALSFLVILPVYKLSEYSPKLYSIVILAVLFAAVIFAVLRLFIVTYRKYLSVSRMLCDIFFIKMLPSIMFISIVILEAAVYRVSFAVSFLIFIFIELVFNLLLISASLFILNRRNMYKMALKNVA